MPRYNLNQEDIEVIVSALRVKADQAWSPQEQNRIRRLILRLEGKIKALNENVNTTPIETQEKDPNAQPTVHDDSIWSFYSSKDK